MRSVPYIHQYSGKTLVIKYGGNAMVSDTLRRSVMSDIVLLNLVGIRVVVVHGGGPEINELLKKTGKESNFVNGLRYTDEETMEAVQMVLCGKVNKNLVATLNRAGGQAVGLCGLDGGLFQAKMLDEKYGLVGEIVKVEAAPVFDALNCGYIPVVSTVAQGGGRGGVLQHQRRHRRRQAGHRAGGGEADPPHRRAGPSPGPQG